MAVEISHSRHIFSDISNSILSANDVSFYTTISDVTVDTDCCQLNWSRVVASDDDGNDTYTIHPDAIIAGYSVDQEPIYFAKVKGRSEQAVVNFALSTVVFRSSSNNSLSLSAISILTNPNKCTFSWVRQSPCTNLQVHRSDMTNSKSHYLEPDLCDPSKTDDEDDVLCIDCYKSLRNHIDFQLSEVIFNVTSLLEENSESITLNQVDITNIGTSDQTHEVSLVAQMVLFVKIDLPNWKLPSYFSSVLNVTNAQFDSSGMKEFINLLTHGLDGNGKEYVKEKVNYLLANGNLFISERRTINRFNQTINFNAKSVTTQTITGTLVQGSLPLTVKFKITPKVEESNLALSSLGDEGGSSGNGSSLWNARKIKSFLLRSQFPDMEKVSVVDDNTLDVTYEGTMRINDVIDEKLVIRSTRFSE